MKDSKLNSSPPLHDWKSVEGGERSPIMRLHNCSPNLPSPDSLGHQDNRLMLPPAALDGFLLITKTLEL